MLPNLIPAPNIPCTCDEAVIQLSAIDMLTSNANLSNLGVT